MVLCGGRLCGRGYVDGTRRFCDVSSVMAFPTECEACALARCKLTFILSKGVSQGMYETETLDLLCIHPMPLSDPPLSHYMPPWHVPSPLHPSPLSPCSMAGPLSTVRLKMVIQIPSACCWAGAQTRRPWTTCVGKGWWMDGTLVSSKEARRVVRVSVKILTFRTELEAYTFARCLSSVCSLSE